MVEEQHHAHVVVWQGEQLKLVSAELRQLLYDTLHGSGPAKAIVLAHASLASALQFLDDVNGTAYVAEALQYLSKNLDTYLKFTAVMPEGEVLQ